MAKFQLGGYFGVKTEKNSKCQDLAKFQFFGGCTLESKLKILKVPRND